MATQRIDGIGTTPDPRRGGDVCQARADPPACGPARSAGVAPRAMASGPPDEPARYADPAHAYGRGKAGAERTGTTLFAREWRTRRRDQWVQAGERLWRSLPTNASYSGRTHPGETT
ncbi:conserved hypothetical protein [Ricinus communis]|uniref:Uncharacterized protein n=1 Tax=Ricinus communis TaxID=3988 RepID=B9TBI1_RICCO|nr:conserved hypothetical protein [Ricinus communis]